MNAPQGPNDANQAWAPSPEQSDNPAAPAAQPETQAMPTVPTAQAAPESHDPNPYGANPYANAGYPAPEQGQMPGQYNQYGQPYPGAPAAPQSAPAAQWGGAAQQWGQQAPGQQAQPAQQAWNAQPAGAPQPGSAPQWGAPAPGQPQWGGTPQGGYPQAGGYPQQGYPTQQYGAPQQNQWGAPVPPASAPSADNKKVLMWVGILVAAVVVVGGILFAVGSFGSKTLDQGAAQKGVEQIVTESYGARAVTGVSCPSGQKVEKGASFECSLTVDGTPKKVTVTFTDDEGTYEVSRPN
ncbi:DUF4333 domain-containing protein [Prescottella soli]|uniref:DUF4333 domain-containing protein n=1 Tax=Prescottella soli TaxID=1543852 RepID=A0ABW9FW44_9NOCA